MSTSCRVVHPYTKGDAPEVRVAYLRGVVLQDNEFISSGHCFFIKDEVPDGSTQCVATEDIYIDDGPENERAV